MRNSEALFERANLPDVLQVDAAARTAAVSVTWGWLLSKLNWRSGLRFHYPHLAPHICPRVRSSSFLCPLRVGLFAMLATLSLDKIFATTQSASASGVFRRLQLTPMLNPSSEARAGWISKPPPVTKRRPCSSNAAPITLSGGPMFKAVSASGFGIRNGGMSERSRTWRCACGTLMQSVRTGALCRQSRYQRRRPSFVCSL
jgi:hypothetical protein